MGKQINVISDLGRAAILRSQQWQRFDVFSQYLSLQDVICSSNAWSLNSFAALVIRYCVCAQAVHVHLASYLEHPLAASS